MPPVSVAQYVDTRGSFCPIPIVELARAVRACASGEQLELLATDPAIKEDLSAWCEATGNSLQSFEELPGRVFRAIIRIR